MLSILRRARRTNATANVFTTMRSTLLLALVLALSLCGSAAQAEVAGNAVTDEVAAILSAQPEGTLAAPAEPLGRKELPETTSTLAPEAAITCNGAGGLWSAAGSWTGGIPTAADSVTIGSGCTITIDTAATALTIVVQSGGVLEYDAAVAQTLTVVQSVTIDAGGIFRTPATGTVTAHVLSVGTDLTNNGTLDFSTNANTAGAVITFTGAGNATFGGSGATTNIRTLTINKGTSFANTLELSPSNFTVQGTTTDGTPMAFLTLTNGTLKVSGTFTLAGRFFTAAGYTIPATGGFWLNNPNVTVSGQTASPTNNGLLRLSSGIFNAGTASGNSMGGGSGAFFTIEGGTLNVAGRLNSSSTNITYRQSGGTVNVSTVGNAASTTPSFGFTGTGTVSFFSGGTINLVQASTGATPVDYNQGGTMNFTGGTLNVGTAATATNFVFRVQGQMPAVVIDNTTNNKTANLSGQGNVWGNLTINPGTTLNPNSLTLVMIGPLLTNNGAIAVTTNNTGTVNFAGGLQQLGAPYAQTYAGTGTFGTAALRVGSFSVQSPLGVTLDPAVSNLNIYRVNDFYGPITNASKFAIGNADAVASVIQRGVGGNAFAAGSLDVAPTFNVGGAGGLTLVYAQSTSAITTGPEIPVTRTVLSFQIANSTGVTLAGGGLTSTGTTNGLVLSGGTLTTSAANLLTLTATTAGAVSGGTGLTYVNGPLARTLPASLVSGSTYTFPVGKGTFKMLELVNPTTNVGGTVVVQTEVFDANSGGTAGVGFSSINTNRYWSAVMTSGAANFTNATVRLTEQGTVAINAIGQSATQAGAYDSIGGTVAAPVIGPSSTVTSLGFFAIGTLTGSTTMCGNFDVGAATSPPNFTTLTAAVTALNSRIMTCAVTFTLLDAVYAAETYPIIIQPNGGASATNTLTIKPGVGVNASFTGSSASTLITLNGADWVTIDGSNTVGGTTRNTTFANTNVGTTSAVIWGQSVGTNDPATNNILKNLNIVGNAPTTTLVGIGFGSSTIGTTSVGSRNDNNRIQNNLINSTQIGIFSQGASSVVKNVGTVITGNTVGGAATLAVGRTGIYVAFDDGAQITNNTIAGVAGGVGSVDAIGIALGSLGVTNSSFGTNNDVANVTVTGNFIGPVLRTDTFSAVGISIGTALYGTSLVANNSVYGVLGNGTAGDFSAGMYVGSTGTNYATTLIYYNSVSMVGNRDTGGATSQPAFALAIFGANPKVDLRNNVLYNTSTAGTGGPGGNAGSYAIGLSSTAPYSNLTSNYNDLFTSGASSHFAMAQSLSAVAFDLPTLAAWQAATGKDANSISADPTFSSTTNLQPSPGTPLVNAGTPVAVTVDILNIARSVTTPTIGAYEQAADVAGPVITYTAFGNTTSTANRVLAITATDFTGVPTAGIGLPVVYLRKGLAGAYSASQCAFVSGSSYNCTLDYSLLGGVATGDTIQYYVVAQDTLGNVSANPSAGAGTFTTNPPAAGTPPTVPNSYLISPALTGTKTLCASGCDYATLTGAGGVFAAINAGVATGNIVIEIGSDLVVGEDGSVALNPLAEEPPASNYTVRIYPTGAARAITSTTAPTGGFIRLNGADRVTIDGSIGGTGTDRSLTITDTNTGTSSAVIQLQTNGVDGAANNTLKNLVVVGNSNTTTFVGITSGGAGVASLGADNDNTRIENCDIRKVQFGIALQGASVVNKNTGTVITRNLLNSTAAISIAKGGILLSFDDGAQVTENTIGGIVSTTSNDVFGISLGGLIGWTNTTATGGSEVTNATVTRNAIGAVQQTTTFSATGIIVTPTTTGTNLIANNFISGVIANGTTGDFGSGIFVVDSGTDSTTRLYANSVSMTGTLTGADQGQYALAVNGSNPLLDVQDNIFLNTQATGAANNSYAIGLGYATFTNLTSNYNVLFVPAAGNFRVGRTVALAPAGGTDATTLLDWQTATGNDANSLSTDPQFSSTTDLHLLGTSPAASAGTPLAAVTVDFDNDPRDPTTPDIGADEIRYADLSITKTDGSATEIPGTSVTYTIVVSNAGPYAAAATVTDNFPVALSGCSTTCLGAGGGSCSAGPVVGNLSDTASLPAGGSATYTATCNIAGDATGTLDNTATVAASGTVFDPANANNSATDSDTLAPEADLSITKTDGVTSATPGGSVTYTIVASNAGPSAAPGSNVTDNFTGTLSCSTTCVGAGGGTCTAAPVLTSINDTVNLPVGGSVTYTAVCAVSSTATGSLVNTATVTAAGGITDPSGGNNSATDTDTLAPEADLSITKTDGVTNVTAGGTTTYTIVASNAGPSDAPGSNVTDTFPGVLSCSTTCVGAGGGTCTAGPIVSSINDTVNLPAGSSVTYTAVCSVDGSATGSLVNTATVATAGGITDPASGNNSATDTDTVAPQADLSITKTDGVTAATPGTNTTYTIVASNAGPSNAPTAAVIDIFPAACTSANWTCSGSGGGTCAASGSGNINQSVSLPSGASVTFIAVCAISPTATGTLSNTATIGVGVNDPNTANNSATDVDTLSNEIFIDGFETGDTSQWSATVPLTFEAYASVDVAAGSSEAGFAYDFAAVKSGEALAPSPIAFVTDAAGKPLFLVGARRTDANGQLELTLEVVGGGRSSWVAVGEVGQQVRIEWSAADANSLGHVAVYLDGRLALWVEGFDAATTPAGVKLLRAPAPVAP